METFLTLVMLVALLALSVFLGTLTGRRHKKNMELMEGIAFGRGSNLRLSEPPEADQPQVAQPRGQLFHRLLPGESVIITGKPSRVVKGKPCWFTRARDRKTKFLRRKVRRGQEGMVCRTTPLSRPFWRPADDLISMAI